MKWRRLPPGYRLSIVFVLTIFTPGIVLAAFGARSLWQQRQSVNARLMERLNHSAGITARSLQDQLAHLQKVVDDYPGGRTGVADWANDGEWAFVVRDGDALRLFPPNVLPFELSVQETFSAPDASSPVEIAHREARELRDAGRTADAVRRWREVEQQGGWIGPVPADLVAGYEIAQIEPTSAQAFYGRLAGGRWRIEKARYLHYSERMRFPDSSHRHAVVPSAREAEGLRLADAVDGALAGSRLVSSGSRVHVVLHRTSPVAALVVSDRFIASRIPPAADAALMVARISVDGRPLLAAGRGDGTAASTKSFGAGGMLWSVEVEPRDGDELFTAFVREADLYLAMLGAVLALLLGGGYAVFRTVRHELAVARLKSDFVSTVSHEFRSPLTGIRQLGEMLARGRVADEERRHQYYELIVRESERLGRLVDSMLDFARLEEGRKTYRLEPLQTAVWLQAVAREFEDAASRTGYVLQATIPATLPTLSGDREALTTAVRNLLDNAVKYSPDVKTVWLDAFAEGGSVRICVRDRGVGLSPSQRERVFEKFYRADGELGKRVKGVGLGLSLARHIVESHHGTISVHSREGEGSTFSIVLSAAA